MNKWYLYENEEVVGPFDPGDLSGRIDEDTLVCRAGEEEWNPAGEVADLRDVLREEEEPRDVDVDPVDQPDDAGDEETTEEVIEPTLDNLVEICERASDRTLITEFEQHRQEYDDEERRILREELEERGLGDRVE